MAGRDGASGDTKNAEKTVFSKIISALNLLRKKLEFQRSAFNGGQYAVKLL
jgi:hypothetical protein